MSVEKTDPRTSEMVIWAISSFGPRGATIDGIRSHIRAMYCVDMVVYAPRIREYLAEACANGALQRMQTPEIGVRFRIPENKMAQPSMGWRLERIEMPEVLRTAPRKLVRGDPRGMYHRFAQRFG